MLILPLAIDYRRNSIGRSRRHTETLEPVGCPKASGLSLLTAAGVRDGRLHDARQTAATVLLLLGVPERTVMGLMGWSRAP